MMNFTLQLLGWLTFSAVLMSFIEHQVHRNMMHRKNFLCRFPVIKKVFEHHAILHHGQYYREFSDEPVAPGEDRGVRLSVKEGFIEALPFSALIAIVSWQCAIVFPFVVCAHHYIWNKIHLQMHKPEDRFFAKWPVYKFLARHHFVHHKHPDTNFNVVLPLADWILGTHMRATQADLQEMYDTGLLPVRPAPARTASPSEKSEKVASKVR